jgi:hypothetical protein
MPERNVSLISFEKEFRSLKQESELRKGICCEELPKCHNRIQQGIMILEAIPWTTKSDKDVPIPRLLSKQS